MRYNLTIRGEDSPRALLPTREGSMDQRARMWKTLASLVVAMTGTSALLGWMDPSPGISAAAPPPGELLDLARTTVAADINIARGFWTIVVIEAVPDAPGAMLAATDGRDVRHHFRIDTDGRPVRLQPWYEQRAADGWPQTIRIAVAQADADLPMAPAQWLSVRAMIHTLRDAVGPTPDATELAVHLGQQWGRIYGVEADTPLHVAPL